MDGVFVDDIHLVQDSPYTVGCWGHREADFLKAASGGSKASVCVNGLPVKEGFEYPFMAS